MLIDAFNRFSNNQSLAIAIGTAPSTDVIDLGITNGIPSSANGGGARDIGIGYPEKLLVQITTAATSGGAGTMSVTIQGAPDNGAGAPGAYASWWTSPVYTLAQMVIGARLMDMDFPRPPQGVAMPRYLRLLYTVATADLTGGAVLAAVILNRMDQPYNATDNAVIGGYPPGIAIAN